MRISTVLLEPKEGFAILHIILNTQQFISRLSSTMLSPSITVSNCEALQLRVFLNDKQKERISLPF